MHKYKICVYAIAKNEEKFIKRWYESMKEADEIYVLDTGSTDNTYKILKELNINVIKKEITPWRFDIARNESLNIVPKDTDICVCTDIDEIFNPGWRNELEKIWNNCDRINYDYNWNFDENNKPNITYLLNKINTRKNYIWKYPVHEVLVSTKQNEIIKYANRIILNHYPDKNKSRKDYLPLLELAIKENPLDERNLHYLGREYMYYNKYTNAIKYLKKHIKIATFKEEKSASMRFIARCYEKKGKIKNSIKWYTNAIKENPYLRDPYIEKALLMYKIKKYNEVIYLCNQALDIKENKKEYINEIFSYDHTIYDLLSLCYYYKQNIELAIYYINKALQISPTNKRLLQNKNFFIKQKKRK